VERHAQGRGLGVYRVAGEGQWKQIQLVEGLRNPSWLCLHPEEPVLYAVHGDFSQISTFDIASDGSLQRVAEQDTCGMNPVHAAISPSRSWLLIANYASGNVATMRVGQAGRLGAVAHVLKLIGERGPHAQQDGSHPHQICFSPDGRFACVPDKGLDTVFALRLNEDTGVLQIAAQSPMRRGSGPRHMAFHPSLAVAYVVGELNRTVVTMRYDAARGELHQFDERSTVPPGVESGSAAGIVLAHDASRLFVSNRGHDSVAVFSIAEGGALSAPTWVATRKTPRFIGQMPDGGPFVVACEDGHSIATLAADEHSFSDVAQTGSPVCVVVGKANP
jgi:6-phosphogluconolactonase (cycloisomerase 2 family)